MASLGKQTRRFCRQNFGAKKHAASHISALLIIFPLAVLLVMHLTFEPPVHTGAKDYFYLWGSAETGAVNLVTSIYLGYRAFDTLGETIVLMLSITGVIFLMGKPS